MTTLTEFKEIEIHDMDDTEITRLYENALPALIAVAEEMEIKLREIVRREQEEYDEKRKKQPKSVIECSVLIIAQDALAAFEAWKNEIEGEK